jgi:Tfp pilus assembly protein PilF
LDRSDYWFTVASILFTLIFVRIFEQVSQRLGKPVEALYYFNTALDLDPKQASAIKAMIDELGAEADMPDAMDLLDDL